MAGMKIYNVTATLENNMVVSLETKHVLTMQPINYTAGHLSQRNEKSAIQKTCA